MVGMSPWWGVGAGESVGAFARAHGARADGEFWKAVTLKGHSKGLSKDGPDREWGLWQNYKEGENTA